MRHILNLAFVTVVLCALFWWVTEISKVPEGTTELTIGDVLIENENVTYTVTGVSDQGVFFTGEFADGTEREISYSKDYVGYVKLKDVEDKVKIAKTISFKGNVYVEYE